MDIEKKKVELFSVLMELETERKRKSAEPSTPIPSPLRPSCGT